MGSGGGTARGSVRGPGGGDRLGQESDGDHLRWRGAAVLRSTVGARPHRRAIAGDVTDERDDRGQVVEPSGLEREDVHHRATDGARHVVQDDLDGRVHRRSAARRHHRDVERPRHRLGHEVDLDVVTFEQHAEAVREQRRCGGERET